MDAAVGTLKVAVTEGALLSLLLLSLAVVVESLLPDVTLLLSLGVVIVYETLILLSSLAEAVSLPPPPPPPLPPPPTSPRWDLMEAFVGRELEGGALMVKLADTCCSAEVLLLLDDEGTLLLTSELASTDGTRSLMRVDEVVLLEVVAVVDELADGSLSLLLLVEFFFLTSCSALLISSRVTPWVERRVSRTRLACAFR